MHKKRIQSPSSINTYKQCPRKYFYKYILGLPTKPSFHQVRGKIAHSVLEDFFDIDTSNITMENFENKLKKQMQDLFLAHWQLNQQLLNSFGIHEDQAKFYVSETLLMLLNWLEQFIKRIKGSSSGNFQEAFQKLTPLREQEYFSPELYVHGFVDAIERVDGEIAIMDYKTSTNFEIEDEQKLQLAIYSLLYKKQHGKLPDKAGIYFLRYKPRFIQVNNQLLEQAKKEIELIHERTATDNIDNYPLKPSPLCKHCDFYSICFEQKTIKDYLAVVPAKEPEEAPQE